jgi:hypothetical protein
MFYIFICHITTSLALTIKFILGWNFQFHPNAIAKQPKKVKKSNLITTS